MPIRSMKFFARKLTVSLLAVFASSVGYCQVTIGLDEKPVSGSLLQLKTLSDASSAGGANCEKGVGMPRIILTHKYDLTDILSNPTENQKLTHVGLLVYQMGYQSDPVRGDFCPGLYVWDGNEWQPLMNQASQDESSFDAATEILTDNEGNEYTTADFGSAGRWMTQNLRSKFIAPCQPITFDSGSETQYAEPRYYYPGGTSSTGVTAPSTWNEQQGLLYNWAAATNRKGGADGLQSNVNQGEGEPNAKQYSTPNANPINVEETGIRGICPKGWHLPSDKEWNQLEWVIGIAPGVYNESAAIGGTWNDDWRFQETMRADPVGKMMKSRKVLVANLDPDGDSKLFDCPIRRGFAVLMTGTAEHGFHSEFGKYGYFWTSSSAGKKYVNNVGEIATSWSHHYTRSTPRGVRHAEHRAALYSVRCKMDDTGEHPKMWNSSNLSIK